MKYYTIRQIAEETGVTRQAISIKIKRKKIPVKRKGRLVFIARRYALQLMSQK